MGRAVRTIAEDGGDIVILDQTRLPEEVVYARLKSLADAAHAIRSMQVRGAPLIGATAAYGVALGLAEQLPPEQIFATLAATRPTAVNLHWALARVARVLEKSALTGRRELAALAWSEARNIALEDAEANAAIGRHGLEIVREIAKRKQRVEVMTHCNAGWLATAANGTALSPVYAAWTAGIDLHVWVSETRPRNQGLLTAWELAEAAIPHTLIVDNAAGLLMMQGQVDCIIVGADRIASNGDTANKIGTYLKALAARAHGVPFYVAAPISTIDFACVDGAHIPIEERAASEVTNGDVPVANPAFDVTPSGLIAGIITEVGVIAPNALQALER